MAEETILMLSAHSDDFVLGAGGTHAKYAQEGKHVVAIVFSYGEASHPWLKKHVTMEMRMRETEEAVKVLGAEHLHILGLTEGKFEEELISKKAHQQLIELIKTLKPSKIFTHSVDDPHPDHRAVYKETLKLMDEVKFKGHAYSYNVWNPINVRKRKEPKLIVDISKTFKQKIESLKKFKSQRAALIQLIPLTYWRAIRSGISNKTKFAEIFIKIR